MPGEIGLENRVQTIVSNVVLLGRSDVILGQIIIIYQKNENTGDMVG